jgi:hypothetical protein
MELLAECSLDDLVALLCQLFEVPDKRLELAGRVRATAVVDHMRTLIDATGRSDDDRELHITAIVDRLPKGECNSPAECAALLASVADAVASVTDEEIARMKQAADAAEAERVQQALIDEMARALRKRRVARAVNFQPQKRQRRAMR